MTTKLTLSIDKLIINKAKRHLQSKDQSLSNLVEDYFRLLIRTQEQKKVEKTNLISELTGIAKTDKNAKDVITDYLQDKYK